MNLAIVSPYPPDLTGIGQYGFYMSRALAQSGQFRQITVVAGTRNATQRRVATPAINVEYAWRPERLGNGAAIVSAIRRQNPDLVWFNMGASVFGRSPLANLLGFLSLSIVKAAGPPVVVTLHELVELADLRVLDAPGGGLARLGARLLTNLATQADVVCLTMHHYATWLAAQRPNLTCVHIPIGAYRTPERLEETKDPELLFFTTLAPYKGLDILIRAYLSLLSTHPTLRLTIAGAEHPRFPGYREKLRQQYGALPGIHWAGTVQETEIRALFERAQVVVLPYLASTGSSSVLYQAAMWGRALVASDLVETRTVAEESGLQVEFFKNRETAELAEAIQGLLEKPERRREQIEHNFKSIQLRRPEVTCHAYLQAFNLALEAHSCPKRIEVPVHYPSEPA